MKPAKLLFKHIISKINKLFQNSAFLGYLGNGMTSRMLSTPVHIMMSLSKPSPKPPCVLSQLSVPPVRVNVEVLLFDHSVKLLQVLLSGTAANKFSDAWNKHVHRLDCLSIFILLHVESFKSLGVVVNNNWLLVDLLSKVAFVLRSHIHAPERLNQKLDLLFRKMRL